MTKFTRWLKRPQTGIKSYRVKRVKAQEIIAPAKREGSHALLEPEACQVLRAYGFPVIKSTLARNEREAVEAAEKIGFPVVMKIASSDVLHKFDYGGVKLDLKNREQVKKAQQGILESILRHKPNARITGMTIEEMAPPGKEIILGTNRDAQFGPILMFGLGGIYVEALDMNHPYNNYGIILGFDDFF
jgi:acyl-CoA synthetase (NDP forming)